jgi:hypothetical protein
MTMGPAVPERGEPSGPAWPLVCAGWIALGLLRVLLWDAAAPLPARVALLQLSSCVTWAAMTPAIVALARALPWAPRRAPQLLAAHVGAALIAAAVDTGAFLGVRALLFPHLGLRGAVGRLLVALDLNAVQYLAVAALAYAARHHDLALRAAAAATSARLELLATKLHPHFLYNTLNTVAELWHRDLARARRVVDDLRALLRVALGPGRRAEVTVAEEVALLERYLDIQRARFGARLGVEVTVAPAARALRVPHLLLQPLVENAVRHGVGRRGDAHLRVEARRRGAWLELVVGDRGPGFTRAVDEGVGLRNTRARLAALGPGAGLEIRGDAGGAEVVARLPARAAPAAAAPAALPPRLRRRTVIAAVAGGLGALWLVWVGLRLARVGRTHGPVATEVLLSNTAQLLLVYAAVMLLAVAAVRRWPIAGARRRSRLALHVALGGAAALVLATARVWINRGFGAPLLTVNNVVGLPYELAVLALVMALAHGALFLGAARARAVEAAESALAARRLELDPGWLDAELAAIAAVAARDPDAADDQTAALADRLRGLIVEERG